MIRRFSTIAAIASAVMLSVAVYAAEPMTPAPGGAAGGPAVVTPSAPAPASAVPTTGGSPEPAGQVKAAGPPIVVEAGKGSLIRLPRPAATVFIANPDVADVQVKTPTMIYLSAKAPGETVLYAVDAEDHVLLNAPVRVEHDLARVRQSLGELAPGDNVSVSSVDNSLVLNGNVSSAGRAEKVRSLAAAIASETKGTVINRMAVATPNQVSIRVKIAEVNRQVLKSLGVNWNKDRSFPTGAHTAFATQNPTTVAGNIPNQFGIAFGAANWLSDAVVSALTQEGLVTILAEPNLTATNGQPASFLAGGEFPVPVAGAAATGGAAATITVEFKRFGVSLDATPTIIDADHLNLRIRTEASQLTTTGEVSVPITASATVTIPALSVRRAETTVELGSGQSYVLGGLIQNTDTQNVSKVPALGDIPILGQLFRSQQFQRNETELVIIVTPYLIKPAPNIASLATPIDGMVPAHDAQQIINGGLYRQTLPVRGKGPVGEDSKGLIGPVGFRLD